MGSLRKHELLHVSKRYIQELKKGCENFAHIGWINFSFWCTEKSCKSLEGRSSPKSQKANKEFLLDEKSLFGPVLAFSVAGKSLLVQ